MLISGRTTEFEILVKICDVLGCVVLFTGRNEQDGIVADVVLATPRQWQNVEAFAGLIEFDDFLASVRVLDDHVNAPSSADEELVARSVRMIATRCSCGDARNRKESLWRKRQRIGCLSGDQPPALVARFHKRNPLDSGVGLTLHL